MFARPGNKFGFQVAEGFIIGPQFYALGFYIFKLDGRNTFFPSQYNNHTHQTSRLERT